MEAGSASSGAMLTGPIKPSFQHPEWQGSVPSHWMDRGTGYQRGKVLHSSDVRDGFDGVARQGLGAFAVDVPTRLREESMRRTRQNESAHLPVAPWGDHPQEVKWKPSRRKLEDHEFEWRVGPRTSHAGLLAHAGEPEVLSKRPPFVEKGGTKALPNVYCAEVERCRQQAIQKTMLKRHRAAVAEDRFERSQVLGLEAWERSHLRRSTSAAAAANGTRLGGTGASAGATQKLSADATSRLPQRAQSESKLEFCRRRS